MIIFFFNLVVADSDRIRAWGRVHLIRSGKRADMASQDDPEQGEASGDEGEEGGGSAGECKAVCCTLAHLV